MLGSVQDSSHPYGAVGLFTRTYDTANITIAYDNFIVYDASDAGYGDVPPSYDGPMVGDGPIFMKILKMRMVPGSWAILINPVPISNMVG